MATIDLEPMEAPSSPLNLRFDVPYAPRIPTPPHVGYMAVENADGSVSVYAYEHDGIGAETFRGDLARAYSHLAYSLRMDA